MSDASIKPGSEERIRLEIEETDLDISGAALARENAKQDLAFRLGGDHKVQYKEAAAYDCFQAWARPVLGKIARQRVRALDDAVADAEEVFARADRDEGDSEADDHHRLR
ncbi:MAG: hypothetical protein M1826_005377 [Phylliscum demangeonii]|nr:MAG: hypothetical protein M1826_005377 [Phylliscum demangeonii]